MIKKYDQGIGLNHTTNWLYNPDHPYTILIIGSSESR